MQTFLVGLDWILLSPWGRDAYQYYKEDPDADPILESLRQAIRRRLTTENRIIENELCKILEWKMAVGEDFVQLHHGDGADRILESLRAFDVGGWTGCTYKTAREILNPEFSDASLAIRCMCIAEGILSEDEEDAPQDIHEDPRDLIMASFEVLNQNENRHAVRMNAAELIRKQYQWENIVHCQTELERIFSVPKTNELKHFFDHAKECINHEKFLKWSREAAYLKTEDGNIAFGMTNTLRFNMVTFNSLRQTT